MIVKQLALILLLGSCSFAWWKGGPAERWGALCLTVPWVGSLYCNHPEALGLDPRWVLLATDTFLGAAFLLLALRYSSAWLGAAMVLQGLVLSLNALRWAEAAASVRAYVIANNVISLLLLVIIVGGTCASWRKRVQVRRKLRVNIVPELAPSPV